jgi:hypothetical protein
MTFLKVKLAAAVLCFASAIPGQEDAEREERLRIESSVLHQRAIAAGGKLHTVNDANPSNLYASLTALANASDLVILAHVGENSCGLSPSGTAPVTIYEVGVFHIYKGHADPTIHVSLPTGAVSFADGTHTSSSVASFFPLVDGGRYVLFLRSARGEERRVTPGYRLAGDGVQGAFLLDDETVMPNFRGDAFWRTYFKMSVPDFLSQVTSLTEKREP